MVLGAAHRWRPFYAAMRIPAAIARSPELAEDAARGFLRRSLGPLPPGTSSSDGLRDREHWLGEVLDRVATAYSEAEAIALASWIARHIADRPFSESLATWRRLLRAASRRMPVDEPSAPPAGAVIGEVRKAVATFLDRAALADAAQAVRGAASAPCTAWDEELEALVERQVGVGVAPVLSARETSADLVRLVMSDCRVLSALEALDATLAAQEREALVVWARGESAREGMGAVDWPFPLTVGSATPGGR